MIDFQYKSHYDVADFRRLIHLLRQKDGCPWDSVQTHHSIRNNFLEETYEALDAIDRNDTPGMCEELGDVLLQVVFHSVMEEEQGRFTADDVVDGVAQKLVFRHPHVFGSAEAADSAQALEGWEAQPEKNAVYMQQMKLILQSCLRSGDPFTQIGAGQYWVLLPGAGPETHSAIAQRLQQAMHQRFAQSSAVFRTRTIDLRSMVHLGEPKD